MFRPIRNERNVIIEDYQLYKGSITSHLRNGVRTSCCVTRSIRIANLERAENVVVIGAGNHGLLHVLLANPSCTKVIVMSPS